MFNVQLLPDYQHEKIKGSFNKTKCEGCGEYVFDRYVRMKDGKALLYTLLRVLIMMTIAIASVLVFLFTTVLTIAGVGAAFIIIPTFYWLGIPLTEAMAVALLLNAISMTFASVNYIRYKLVSFKTAIPIILLAVVFSPLGAYSTRYFPKELLIAIFSAFLLFAGSMMLFYAPKTKKDDQLLPAKNLKQVSVLE